MGARDLTVLVIDLAWYCSGPLSLVYWKCFALCALSLANDEVTFVWATIRGRWWTSYQPMAL